jgi:hypothetical protein
MNEDEAKTEQGNGSGAGRKKRKAADAVAVYNVFKNPPGCINGVPNTVAVSYPKIQHKSWKQPICTGDVVFFYNKNKRSSTRLSGKIKLKFRAKPCTVRKRLWVAYVDTQKVFREIPILWIDGNAYKKAPTGLE